MNGEALFSLLAGALDGPLPIERHGREALLAAAHCATLPSGGVQLAKPFLDELNRAGAHRVCSQLAGIPLPWAPPETSDDPRYVALGKTKAHVELLGPGGLVRSDEVRLGLYGILPGSEYGIRTHPAEEIFVMLAGEADWKRGDAEYETAGPGVRSHHPSMMPHATRTGNRAFMSIYVWHGDISTENYVYEGLPGV